MADSKRGLQEEHQHHQLQQPAATGNHEEVAVVDKKYGGLAPKKKPLISKDHERAFFDSADWVLCKKTPHQQLPPRRPACTSGRDSFGSS